MKTLIRTLLSDEDPLVRDLGKYSTIFAFAFGVISPLIFDLWGIVTYFSSALIMLLNYAWLKELVTLLSTSAGKQQKIKGKTAKFIARYVLLGFFLYAIISIRKVAELPLLLGFSVLVVGAFAAAIKHSAIRNKE